MVSKQFDVPLNALSLPVAIANNRWVFWQQHLALSVCPGHIGWMNWQHRRVDVLRFPLICQKTNKQQCLIKQVMLQDNKNDRLLNSVQWHTHTHTRSARVCIQDHVFFVLWHLGGEVGLDYSCFYLYFKGLRHFPSRGRWSYDPRSTGALLSYHSPSLLMTLFIAE